MQMFLKCHETQSPEFRKQRCCIFRLGDGALLIRCTEAQDLGSSSFCHCYLTAEVSRGLWCSQNLCAYAWVVGQPGVGRKQKERDHSQTCPMSMQIRKFPIDGGYLSCASLSQGTWLAKSSSMGHEFLPFLRQGTTRPDELLTSCRWE